MIGFSKLKQAGTLFKVLNLLPKFLNQRLNLDLQNAGFLASLPNIGRAAAIIACGKLSDYISKEYTVKLARKLFALIGFIIGGSSFFLVMLVGCNVIVIMFIICIGMALLAFQVVCVKVFQKKRIASDAFWQTSSTKAKD